LPAIHDSLDWVPQAVEWSKGKIGEHGWTLRKSALDREAASAGGSAESAPKT